MSVSTKPFETCWQRIERAKTHSDAIAKAWNSFLEKDPYTATVHMEDDGTGRIWVEPRHFIAMPPMYALEFGEMLYQFRAALDACIYEAAILETGKNPPPDENHLEFPICELDTEYPKKAARNLGPLPQKCRDIVEAVQPYNTPKVPAKDLMFCAQRSLSILNDWARKDRHRKLHFVGSLAFDAKPMLRYPEGVSLVYMNVTGPTLLEKESQIAVFKLDGFSRGMKIQANPNLQIDIAIDEGPPPCCSDDSLGTRGLVISLVVKGIVSEFEKVFGLR